MELLNFIPDSYKNENATDAQKYCLDESIIFILKMLSPITPHICEYLWNNFNVDNSLIDSWWPKFDENLLEVEEFELIIQVNGKVRGKINIDKSIDQEKIESIALDNENVNTHIGSSKIKKVIYVKEKLINFVI